MGRCLLAALASGVGVWIVVRAVRGLLMRLPGAPLSVYVRWIDLAVLLAGTAVWLLTTKIVLEKSGSALPRVAMKRLGLA
jgi:hypothetical protein